MSPIPTPPPEPIRNYTSKATTNIPLPLRKEYEIREDPQIEILQEPQLAQKQEIKHETQHDSPPDHQFLKEPRSDSDQSLSKTEQIIGQNLFTEENGENSAESNMNDQSTNAPIENDSAQYSTETHDLVSVELFTPESSWNGERRPSTIKLIPVTLMDETTPTEEIAGSSMAEKCTESTKIPVKTILPQSFSNFHPLAPYNPPR